MQLESRRMNDRERLTPLMQIFWSLTAIRFRACHRVNRHPVKANLSPLTAGPNLEPAYNERRRPFFERNLDGIVGASGV